MVWLAAFLVLLVSCAAVKPVEFKGPNGKTAYSMKCSGMGRTLDDCYKKAGELCPDGYSILSQASSVIGSGDIVVPQYHLAIECKS